MASRVCELDVRPRSPPRDERYRVGSDLGASRHVQQQPNHQRRHNDSMLGTLFVSHGAIEWRPARKKTKIKLNWPDFDRRMRLKS